MKIHPITPEIPRFGTPDVTDWFKVEPRTIAPKYLNVPYCNDAGAQTQNPTAPTIPPAPTQTEQELKAGDLVMVQDACTKNWHAARFIIGGQHEELCDGKPFIDAEVIGHDHASCWTVWHLPTDSERHQHSGERVGDGWVSHDGSAVPPIPLGTKFQYKWRGETRIYPIGECAVAEPKDDWTGITHYRLAKA